jgi:hypothetical protein
VPPTPAAPLRRIEVDPYALAAWRRYYAVGGHPFRCWRAHLSLAPSKHPSGDARRFLCSLRWSTRKRFFGPAAAGGYRAQRPVGRSPLTSRGAAPSPGASGRAGVRWAGRRRRAWLPAQGAKRNADEDDHDRERAEGNQHSLSDGVQVDLPYDSESPRRAKAERAVACAPSAREVLFPLSEPRTEQSRRIADARCQPVATRQVFLFESSAWNREPRGDEQADHHGQRQQRERPRPVHAAPDCLTGGPQCHRRTAVSP